MTTANLSVGINTGPALDSLRVLRGELQKLAAGDYTINATDLISKVEQSLASKPFNIRISGALAIGELKTEIGRALREVISQTRRPVSIDGVRLRNTVKLALDTAFRAAHYHIGSHNVSIDPDLFTKGTLGATGFSKFLSNMPLGIDEIALAGKVQNAFRAGVASAPDQIAEQIRQALKGVELLVDANIGVNDAYLQRDLRRALATKGLLLPKVRLTADEETLRASVLAGIGTNHTIDINSASLTAQISAAVKAGFGVTQRPYTQQELDQFGKLHAEYQKLITGTGNRPSPGSKRGKRYDEIMAQASAIKALAESETSRADIRIGINEAALVQQVQTALAREFVVGINSTDLTGKVQAAVTAGMRAGTVAGTLPVTAVGAATGGGDLDSLRSSIDLLNNHLRDAADTTSVRKRGASKPVVGAELLDEDKQSMLLARRHQADILRPSDIRSAALKEKDKVEREKDAAFKQRELQQERERNKTLGQLERTHTETLKDEIRQRLAANKAANATASEQLKSYYAAEDAIHKRRLDLVKGHAQAVKSELEQSSNLAKRHQSDISQPNASRNAAFDAMERARKSKNAAWEQAEADQEAQRRVSAIALEKQHNAAVNAERVRQNQQRAEQNRIAAQQISAHTQNLDAQKGVAKAFLDTKSRVLDLDSKFRNPAAKDDIARLQSQLAKLKNAQDLVRQGAEGAQLALQKYGPLAMSQVGNIGAMTKALEKLQAARSATVRAEKLAERQAMETALIGPPRPGSVLDPTTRKPPSPHDDDGHRKAVRAVGTQRTFNDVMHQSHSLSRGLAGSLGAMWLTWGSTLPLVAGAAIGATLRSVVMTGKDLEYQLKFVAVLAGEASISVTRFGDSVRGSMVTAVEAAQAMRALAQNGLSAKEAFIALPRVLDLATAGEMELAEAALGATGVMAAFNLEVTDLGRIGDVFSKAAAMSNTSVSSMVESMKQASTVGDKYNITLEETAASLAVLAKRNIVGSAAGTAFRNMMSDMASPSRKAREAMAQLGVEIFDTEKKLKPFPTILRELREATLLMDEKSKLQFLGDIFDERGAKAVSSLLSDYQELNEVLTTLQNNTEGFARSVVESLGETVQGKFKKLITEFQLSTTAAFENAKGALAAFVDQLRLLTASDGFKAWLTWATEGIVGLSKYIIDNATALKNLLVTYVSLKGLSIAVSALVALKAALIGVATGAVTAGAAFATMLTMATGGVALIGILAAQYFILRDATSEASRATKAKADATRLAREEAQRNVNNERELLNTLMEEIRLLEEGTRAIDTQAEAQRNLNMAKLVGQRDQADAVVAIKEAELAKAREEDANRSKFTAPMGGMGAAGAYRASREVKNNPVVEALEQDVLNARAAADNIRATISSSISGDQYTDLTRQATAVRNLMKGYRDLNLVMTDMRESLSKQGKSTKGLDNIIFDPDAKSDPEVFKRMQQQLADAKKIVDGHRTLRYTPQSPAGAGPRPERTELNTINSKAQREMEDLRSQLAFEKQLDDLKFSSSKFSPYLAALSAEEREQQAVQAVLQLQIRSLHDLLDLRTKLTLKDPKDALLPQVDEAIQKQITDTRRVSVDAGRGSVLSKVKAENLAEKTDDEFKSLMGRLRGQDDQGVTDLRAKTELKVTDPVKGAGQKALATVMKRYKEEEVKLEQEIQRKTEAKVDLSENELAIQDELINGDKKRLAELRAQAAAQGAIAQQLAIDVETYSRSAEYGFRKFWTEYVSTATSSAELVENAMKNVSSSMEDSLQQFLLTGTFGWKQFGRTIINELTRVMANQATMKILGFASNFMFGGSSGYTFGGFGSSVSGISGYGGTDGSLLNFLSSVSTQNARGGIMSADGRVPLRSFAGGGIARGRMFAEYGEGSWAEAIVPLPDGRSIPVDVRGSEGGKIHQEFHVTVQVQGGQTNAETGNVVSKAVVDTMRGIARGEIKEAQRPGGVLYTGR